MKSLILFTAFAFTSQISLGAILVRGPGVSPSDYSAFLHTHPEAKTYSLYQVEKAQVNPKQEEEFFVLGEHLQKQPDEILGKLKRLQADQPLSATSLQYVYDLSKKGMESTKSAKNKSEFKKLNCKVGMLLTPPSQAVSYTHLTLPTKA